MCFEPRSWIDVSTLSSTSRRAAQDTMRCQGKKGIKGHSIPCQYHVLHKDHRLSDFGTGDLQVVTYQLCHMYARGDKTVSYASPAYLADHCAERGKLYLEMQHGDPGEATELVNQ